MDLSIATNAPREITIAGLPYKVSALSRDEWGRLQAWVKDHARSPLARAYEELADIRKKGVEIDDRDRDALLTKAREANSAWPPIVASPAWFALLNTTDGGPFEFFAIILRKHQPSLSDEQLIDLIGKIGPEDSEVLVWRAIGIDPPPKETGPASPPNRKRRRAQNANARRKQTTS